MIDGLETTLEDSGEPGLPELRGVLLEVLSAFPGNGRLLSEQTLKTRRIYRLMFEIDGEAHTFVAKRFDPSVAQRNQLVATRWLPAADLCQGGPVLLGVAADRNAECVWHVYEDFGDRTLDTGNADRNRVGAAIDLIAQLHVRFAEHPLLPECRMYGHELGIAFYSANVRDAIRGLQSLRSPAGDLGAEQFAVRDRLLQRLSQLSAETPERADALARLGGPETLLHGDLWPANILAVPGPDGLQTRLIDWDKTGVGPLTYDLSTFVYRFAAHDRPWILDRYRRSVAPLEWHVPSARDLNLLLETAELSRMANSVIWPCVAAVTARATWAFDRLAEVERWFASLEPAF